MKNMSRASMNARSSSSIRSWTIRSSMRSARRLVSKRSCSWRLPSWYRLTRPIFSGNPDQHQTFFGDDCDSCNAERGCWWGPRPFSLSLGSWRGLARRRRFQGRVGRAGPSFRGPAAAAVRRGHRRGAAEAFARALLAVPAGNAWTAARRQGAGGSLRRRGRHADDAAGRTAGARRRERAGTRRGRAGDTVARAKRERRGARPLHLRRAGGAGRRRFPRGHGRPLGRGLLPHADEVLARRRERLPVPPAPTLARLHARKLRHQVELRRPDVAERARRVLELAVTLRVVVRDEPLLLDVVLVDADVLVTEVEDAQLLASQVG